MAMAPSKPLSFCFKPNRLGANSAACLDILPDTSLELQAAVLSNKPLPGDTLLLAKGTLGTDGGKDVVLGQDRSVVFHGSASGKASFALILARDPATVLQELALAENGPFGLDLPPQDRQHRFALLRAGYDVGAAGNGTVGLKGAVTSVQFSGTAARDGVFGLVRRIDDTAGAADVLHTVVDNWQLPRQIDRAKDLDPETWLVTEVDGSISLQLGAIAGYDLDWVRVYQAGGLSGDLGLRLQLGVEATLGFKASGRYLLVVSRETAANVLRARLFKARIRGWSFAMNAGGSAKIDVTNLPSTADEFVAAVFGVHGSQVIAELRRLQEWTGGAPLSETLPSLAAGAITERVKSLVGASDGTFQAHRQKLLDVLSRWDGLPQKASSKLWELLAKPAVAPTLRAWAEQLADLSDPAKLRDLVETHLTDVAFFQQPQGQLLEALVVDTLFRSLGDPAELQAIKERAAVVVDLLDPDTDLPVLMRLRDFVTETLKIDRLRDNLTPLDFGNLDPWLKARLTHLLGRAPLFSDLTTLQKTIDLILEKRQEWYATAERALQRSFEMQMAATYDRTTSSEALLDVEFDFDLEDPGLQGLLKEVLSGNMAHVLLTPHPAVRLHVGSLTHGVSRHVHVGLSLPSFDGSLERLNQSLAKATASEVDGTRVLVYELDALDAAQESRSWRGRFQRTSRLSVAMMAGGDVRRHGPVSGSVGYAMRVSRKGMLPAHLEAVLEPWVQAYLGNAFSSPDAGGLTQWVFDLDATVEKAEGKTGTNFLGDTHVALDVLLDDGVLRAWQAVPPATDPDMVRLTCRNASAAVQLALREFIPALYFRRLDRYTEHGKGTRTLLVYATSPPRISKDYHFDWPDPQEREHQVQQAHASLLDRYADISRMLLAAGMKKEAKWYAPGGVAAAQTDALSHEGDLLLASLYGYEAGVVGSVVKAVQAIATFRAAEHGDPTLAMAALEEFGGAMTRALNTNLVSLYTRGALRALGPALLVRLAASLDPSILVGQRALISVQVMKEGAPLPEDGLEKDLPIPEDQVLVEQRLLGGA